MQERNPSSDMLQNSENHNTLRRRVIKKPKIEHTEVKNEVHRIKKRILGLSQIFTKFVTDSFLKNNGNL